jgi:hypothetical protein
MDNLTRLLLTQKTRQRRDDLAEQRNKEKLLKAGVHLLKLTNLSKTGDGISGSGRNMDRSEPLDTVDEGEEAFLPMASTRSNLASTRSKSSKVSKSSSRPGFLPKFGVGFGVLGEARPGKPPRQHELSSLDENGTAGSSNDTPQLKSVVPSNVGNFSPSQGSGSNDPMARSGDQWLKNRQKQLAQDDADDLEAAMGKMGSYSQKVPDTDIPAAQNIHALQLQWLANTGMEHLIENLVEHHNREGVGSSQW